MNLRCSIAFALYLFCHGVNARDDAEMLQKKWGQDWAFSGVNTYAHLPHIRCLSSPADGFDIGIVGAPFDTTVSYRTGARFGPRAIRSASARQIPFRAYNPRAKFNPFRSGAKIIDCGDIPMTEAFKELGDRESQLQGKTGLKPRLVVLGGDHSIALPELRALAYVYGQKITVLHFDAHLDTWDPTAYPSYWLDPDDPVEQQPSAFTHGTQFWLAAREGLIANNSVHAGLRTRLGGPEDNDLDSSQGWKRIDSDAISSEELGPKGVAQTIMETIGSESPVYLSVDIDTLDPGLAPGTGTPEPGGWTTRELIQVLRSLEGLNIVGADVVEVAPSYDGAGEQTALAAAQVVYELLTSIAKQISRESVTGRITSKDEL